MSASEAVTDALRELHARFAGVDEGRQADYIPELTRSDPDDFGLALVSMDGHAYSAGAADTPFTLQSVSKPFVYALALAALGLDEVSRWVGAEPSGEAFNAISLEPGTGRPANAMVNAGAIVTTALVPDSREEPAFGRILSCLSRFAGRKLDVDEDVHGSEAATGDRNRALAYLIRSTGSLPVDPVQAVDTYFRQCAVRATAVDLAVMAATLAYGGVNPVTGERVVSPRSRPRSSPSWRPAECTTPPATGCSGSGCPPRAGSPAACSPPGRPASVWPPTARSWTRRAPRYAAARRSARSRNVSGSTS